MGHPRQTITAGALIESLLGEPMQGRQGPSKPDLMARLDRARADADRRLAGGLDQRARLMIGRPDRQASMLDRAGRNSSGLNFASADYLGLSQHPVVLQAALRAVVRFGLTAGGTAAHSALSPPLLALEERIATFAATGAATVFPSGAQALAASVATLLRPGDHLVVDQKAHPVLAAAGRAAGALVHVFPHGSVEAVERRLLRLRREAARAGILVATTGFFPHTAAIADLSALAELCTRFTALLLVDVAHDFGALGVQGLGAVEQSGLAGRIDVLTGSLAKTFATNGGFAASNRMAFHVALRLGAAGQAQSAALSPVQAAVALAAFDIVQSPEGVRRRARLLANAIRLRNRLSGQGFDVPGQPGPLVPVRLGRPLLARAMTAEAARQGLLLNLIEAPLIGAQGSRWQVSLSSEHVLTDIDRLAEIAGMVRAALGSGPEAAAPVLRPTGTAVP
jgi:glycine C-acetyltransferase